ncbi:uncharacterized protein LOC116180048 [Photinus pyralis]|uniref:uncharacterized protein LOC116180048 n=1 Tax=Photinus pyralis TaxID=7054 RepID=UPI00126752E5|nr:uncharacterized protein LOC116180048 [Photinus pyralis]
MFRAVSLEVVNSLSTEAFIGAFNQFIRLEGRPRLVMSDNGTNFQGCSNFFKSLDWKVTGKDTVLEKIQWKFNVAAAPWWGGYWERIIRILKDMMKRSIGKSTLNRKELDESLLIMEEVINGRPLTNVSEDNDELEPLTPSMVMSNQCELKFPEGEDSENLNYRWKYMKKLRDELRQRFRKEYLSQLISRINQKPSRRVMELIPGKDGIVRVVKVKTEVGLQTKPIQNLYPLEVNPSRTTLMTSLLTVTQIEVESELKPVVSIVGECKLSS